MRNLEGKIDKEILGLEVSKINIKKFITEINEIVSEANSVIEKELGKEYKIQDMMQARYYLCAWYHYKKNQNKNSTQQEKENNKKYKRNYFNLTSYFQSQNFHFRPHQISSFYTALKTKGFVILAGLSGTGKTKMAQLFGELFETELPPYVFLASSGNAKEYHKCKEKLRKEYGKITPYSWAWEKSGMKSSTKELLKKLKKEKKFPIYFLYHKSSTISNNRIGEILEVVDFEELKERKMNSPWKDCPTINPEKKLKEKKGSKYWFKVNRIIKVVPPISPQELELKYTENISHISKDEYSQELKNLLLKYLKTNLFLPVRPDWKDSKSLIGYYNPIMNRYESTPLFEFILKAIADYKEKGKNASPYFVILDEMNLARVEYYFADFLSVLESGRFTEKDLQEGKINKEEEIGFTKEGIKITYGEDDKLKEKLKDKCEIDENSKTASLKLPPNLYFIGTVNIDETTFMFSPKVLDRAFTIEFKEVDFEKYKNNAFKEKTNFEIDIQKLKKDFTIDGKFLTAYGDKEKIKEAYEYEIEKEEKKFKESNYFTNLDTLSKTLASYNLHFAYRVLDEIALFYKNAKEALQKDIIAFKNKEEEKKENNDDEIIDLAVLMKVLPKFHGSRAKLEEPLLEVLKWCEREMEEGKNIEDLIKELKEKKEKIHEEIKNINKYKFHHTAKKVLEMLYKLHTDGYAGYL